MDKTPKISQAADVLGLAFNELLLVDNTGVYWVKDERAEVAQPVMPEMNLAAVALAADAYLEPSNNAADVESLPGLTLRWALLSESGDALLKEWAGQ